jgi:hypothetical protein
MSGHDYCHAHAETAQVVQLFATADASDQTKQDLDELREYARTLMRAKHPDGSPRMESIQTSRGEVIDIEVREQWRMEGAKFLYRQIRHELEAAGDDAGKEEELKDAEALKRVRSLFGQ